MKKSLEILFLIRILLKTNGLNVNKTCPELNAINNFNYTSNNNMPIVWNIHSYIPAEEDLFIHPLKFPNDISYDMIVQN